MQPLTAAQRAGSRHPDWQELYANAKPEALPWHADGLDGDFAMELLHRAGDRLRRDPDGADGSCFDAALETALRAPVGRVAGDLSAFCPGNLNAVLQLEETRARQPSAARPTVLDIGCGAGTQTVALARLGFAATGSDIAAAAIEHARRHATCAAVGDVRFVVDDFRDTHLDGRFDLIVDRGLLHVLEPADEPGYVASAARLATPGGWLWLKCFSAEEPDRGFGPRRFDAAALSRLFAGAFTLESVRAASFDGPAPYRPKSLFCVLRRMK